MGRTQKVIISAAMALSALIAIAVVGLDVPR